MQSILEFQRDERVPQSSLPWAWFGFVFALFFLIAETLQVFLELDSTSNVVFVIIFVAGWIYWLFCVHRLHRILEEMSGGCYPITTGKALGFHFIPFYNFLWVIKWPITFSNYLNEKGRTKIAPGGVLGFLLFLSFIMRFADGAIALFGMFGVVTYMSAKLRSHVENLSGPSASMLPPPPPDSVTLGREAEQRDATPLHGSDHNKISE